MKLKLSFLKCIINKLHKLMLIWEISMFQPPCMVVACNLPFFPLDLQILLFFEIQFFKSAGNVIQQIKKVWPYNYYYMFVGVQDVLKMNFVYLKWNFREQLYVEWLRKNWSGPSLTWDVKFWHLFQCSNNKRQTQSNGFFGFIKIS